MLHGIFAFLRSGEFTVPSASTFDPTWHLTPQDIAIDNSSNPTMVLVTIKGSKTDQTSQGICLVVGRTECELCPVSAILTYMAVRGQSSGPLFRYQDGSPLTSQKLVTALRQILAEAGVNPTPYAEHSFRIGAATTAAARGISDSTIQTLGRWHSESFKRYIRIPHQELASISQTLVQNTN